MPHICQARVQIGDILDTDALSYLRRQDRDSTRPLNQIAAPNKRHIGSRRSEK
jgi:hypothetical protein